MAHHASSVPRHSFFVTGTDTGVGKTLIACALLHAFAARGLRVVGMKPVAAGAVAAGGRLTNEDVCALLCASNVGALPELVNPYCFELPIAPHIAARRAQVTIDLSRIRDAFVELSAQADCVIVEGVGGFRVPLGPHVDTAQLARELDAPVVLVVGMRLGCLNHALLTASAIADAGLRLAGWVANHVDPHMLCPDENVAALRDRIDAPLLARVFHDPQHDPAALARTLALDALQ